MVMLHQGAKGYNRIRNSIPLLCKYNIYAMIALHIGRFSYKKRTVQYACSERLLSDETVPVHGQKDQAAKDLSS